MEDRLDAFGHGAAGCEVGAAVGGAQVLGAAPGEVDGLVGVVGFDRCGEPLELAVGEVLCAGAQELHFASGFALLVGGVLYVVWLAWTGEWRRRHFDVRRDAGDSLATLWSYLRLRKRSRPRR